MQRRVEQPDRHRQPAHRVRRAPSKSARCRPRADRARPRTRGRALELALVRRDLGLARRARPRRHSLAATNIPRTSRSRSAPKNMCSVRQRPIPSAPKLRARAASSGVSALARTPSARSSSAQPQHRRRSRSRDLRLDQRHVVERDAPVEPSIAIRSPARSSSPSTRTTPASRSISSSAAPATHGRPIPRATSAACEALPPSRGEDPPRGVEAGDVVGLGEGAHQDHVLALGAAARPPRRR